ncbi:phosphodiester glycosidase family protein [Paenibacillus sanguinis]|uniref:phosphodiester glycosidase family protein n=1 Tax=Paenibacillus sanguinis TaxID=225906 RepID=UPI0003678812|nr:phosphodiester glycosidase family protein [Paenibacillus sanguinis]
MINKHNKHSLGKLLVLALALICLVPASLDAVAAAPVKVKNVVLLDANTNLAYIPGRVLNGFAETRVQWNPSEKKLHIAKGELRITLQAGSTMAYVNEETRILTSAPFTEAGTAYLPLQVVKDILQVPIKWNKETASVSFGQAEKQLTLPYMTRSTAANQGKAIVSERKSFKIGSRSFKVQTVTISLMDPKVQLKVALAGDEIGKVEDLSSLAKRHKAVVAVNGTFFNAYTSEAHKAPYGYIVSNGELKMIAGGDKRTIFAYDSNLLTQLIPGTAFTDAFAEGNIEGALQAGPRLVVDGKVAIDVKTEGFKDPKILTGGGARSALGITRDHKLILLTTGGATIPQLAEIMKQAGAYQAMNLDGGASSGLYYNGKYLTSPGRKISNALLVTYP